MYATGRFFDSVVELVRTTALPEPDAVICGVGTEIRLFPSGNLVRDWHDQFDRDWNVGRVRQLLSVLPDLEPQSRQWQSEFKASFFLHNASSDQIDSIFETLWGESIFPEIIYSSNRDLDVLPGGVNKGTAAAFLASAWEIPRRQVIVSGDSGNDRALFEQGFRGIVVANARSELKRLNGLATYHAHKPRAAGVLEGLHYWSSIPTSESAATTRSGISRPAVPCVTH